MLLQRTVREVMDNQYFATPGAERTRSLTLYQAQAFFNTLLFPSQEIMVELNGHEIVADWFKTLEKTIQETTLRPININDVRFVFTRAAQGDSTHAYCAMDVFQIPDTDAIRTSERIAEIYMHGAYTPCVSREDVEQALPGLNFPTLAEFISNYPMQYAPCFDYLADMSPSQLNGVLSMQEVMSLFEKANIPELTAMIQDGRIKPGHHAMRDFRDNSKVIATLRPAATAQELSRDGETVYSKIYMPFAILDIYRKDSSRICAVTVQRADHNYVAKRGGPQSPAWVVQEVIDVSHKTLLISILSGGVSPVRQTPVALASCSSNPNKGTTMVLEPTKLKDILSIPCYKYNGTTTCDLSIKEAVKFMEALYSPAFQGFNSTEALHRHYEIVKWFSVLASEIEHLRKECFTDQELVFRVVVELNALNAVLRVSRGSLVLADVTLAHEVPISVNNSALANLLPTLNFMTLDQHLAKYPPTMLPPADSAPLSNFLSFENGIKMLQLTNSPGIHAFMDSKEFKGQNIGTPMFLSKCLAYIEQDLSVGLVSKHSTAEPETCISMHGRVLHIWSPEHNYLATAVIDTDPAGGYQVRQLDSGFHAEMTITLLRFFSVELDTDRAPTTMPMPKFRPLFNVTPTTKESEEMQPIQNHEAWNSRHSKVNEPMILIDGFASMFANTFMRQLDSVDDIMKASQRMEAIFSNCINAAVRHGGWKENILSENDYYYEMFANPKGVVLKVNHGIEHIALFDLFFTAGVDYYNLTPPAVIAHDALAIPGFDPAMDLAGIRIGALNKMLSMEEFQYMFSNAGSVMGASVDDCVSILSLKHDHLNEFHEAIPEWDEFDSKTIVRIDGPSTLTSPDENIIVFSKWERVTFYDNEVFAEEMSNIKATGFLRSNAREQPHTVVKATGKNDATAQIVYEVQNSLVNDILSKAPSFDLGAIKQAAIEAAMADVQEEVNNVEAAAAEQQRMVVELNPELAEKTTPESGVAFAQHFQAQLDNVAGTINPLIKSLNGDGGDVHHLQVNPVQLFDAPLAPSMYADKAEQTDAVEMDSDEALMARDKLEREAALRTTNLSVTSKDYASFMHIVEGAVMPFMSDDRLNLFEAFQNYTEVLVDHTVPHPRMTPVFTASVGHRNNYDDRNHPDSAEIVIRVFVEVRMGDDLKATFLDDIVIPRNA